MIKKICFIFQSWSSRTTRPSNYFILKSLKKEAWSILIYFKIRRHKTLQLLDISFFTSNITGTCEKLFANFLICHDSLKIVRRCCIYSLNIVLFLSKNVLFYYQLWDLNLLGRICIWMLYWAVRLMQPVR